MAASHNILKLLLASGTILLTLWLVLAMFTAMNLGDSESTESRPAHFVEEAPKTSDFDKLEPTSPWRNINLDVKSVPAEAIAAAANISVSKTEKIVENATIVVRKTRPLKATSPFELFFLHGAQFDSEIWEKLGTLQLMAALGYSCTAVDLPGYGKSTASFTGNRVNFMRVLFERLKLDKNIVMVSPSMSGGFSLPFLLTKPELFAGFVPIAPVGTSIVPQNKLRALQMPALYIYGANDKDLGIKARDDLNVIPNLRIITIPNAGHAAYVDQPKIFHQLLYNFLQNLE